MKTLSIHTGQALLLAATCSLAFVSCSKTEENNEEAQQEELAIVDVEQVHVQQVPQIKSYTANIEALNLNNISPATPNRIATIAVQEGDHVTRGQVLVTLDASNIDQLKVSLDQIKRELDRATQLLNIGAGTQQSVDALQAQYDAQHRQYQNLRENTILTSPITGVVIKRNYDPGDMTGAQPILTVGQITPSVKAIINITETDLQYIKKGIDVDVTLDAYPDMNITGKIARIYPNVDIATRTFQAEVLIPNSDGRILPGMFARVSVDLGTRENVVISDRAIIKQPGSGNKVVYTYSNGKVKFNFVELGQRIGNTYELLGGVHDGDTVVVSGQVRLVDGAQVVLSTEKGTKTEQQPENN